jgi:hypothetical protein
MSEELDLREFPYGNVSPEIAIEYRQMRGKATQVAVVKIINEEVALSFEGILSINVQERFDSSTARKIANALSYYAMVIEARQDSEFIEQKEKTK